MVHSACPGRCALCPTVLTVGITYWRAKKLLWHFSKKLTVHLGLHQWCPRERKVACSLDVSGVYPTMITPVFQSKLPPKSHASTWLGLLAAPQRQKTPPWPLSLPRCLAKVLQHRKKQHCTDTDAACVLPCSVKNVALGFCPKRVKSVREILCALSF